MYGTDASTAGPSHSLAGLGDDGRPFALLYRPGSASNALVEVLTGEVQAFESLAELPLPAGPAGGARHDLLVAVPYRQITERGFDCVDDQAPLLAMQVHEQSELTLEQALMGLPEQSVQVSDSGFDISDEDYAGIVERVLADEIGQGAGSNFVIRRSFTARLDDYSVRTELAVFRRLLTGELGSYWTFLFHTGAGTFIGASPERHVSRDADGTVSMNPISGTYRHPATGPDIDGLLEFLNDPKEANELYMVVDEELKMMARMCTFGGQIQGPFLKEMARLTHSEYILTGHSDLDVRDVLRETLLAPTVTGSPLENAFRVIRRHETTGRGYYGGVLAVIGHDAAGGRTLDSAIMIRTAEVGGDGRLRLGVGASLVRDSRPNSEVAETRAKAAGMLKALGLVGGGTEEDARTPVGARSSPATHPQVRQALKSRNRTLSRFWLDGAHQRRPDPALEGRRVLVVDNEDTFTGMLGHQLRSLGLRTTLTRFDEPLAPAGFDLVIVGPGPGDPRDTTDPRMATLRVLTRDLLAGSVPFLSICLAHQILAREIGLDLVRRAVPNQGVQKRVDLFDRSELVGFYNTYAARTEHDFLPGTGRRKPVDISRNPRTGEVHALRGAGFQSVQFHLESVLTQHGPQILGDLLASLLDKNWRL
ncbi:anthranilate synthase family protein [Streptomyces sp. NBC_01283]|uniref:anthranilate synthase family protein n=1 Tax=Streptomyces sp. NBC_01283 TaxID=2903812 RepID=UPI00352C28CC|nr:anthranilate synthase family protein [Streptomyces sp. NBC_01283]